MWKKEKIKKGVPSNWDYVADYAKEFGIDKDLKKSDDWREATEEEIRKFNEEVPTLPDATFEDVRDFLPPDIIVTEDGTIIEHQS